MMETDERIPASDALAAWFVSQDLKPTEAVEIMAITIARAMVLIGQQVGRDPTRARLR
jgi:hypothetical protein